LKFEIRNKIEVSWSEWKEKRGAYVPE
jgi:hypothetical protein